MIFFKKSKSHIVMLKTINVDLYFLTGLAHRFSLQIIKTQSLSYPAKNYILITSLVCYKILSK